ncbi:hypothetical protein B0H66DRAFT_296359 [Apodospora peruviana]|uniref:Uncharacterized protein n=1 Tax=Apodospora peruviana TaxID=516989 RepID=A0AAE0M2L9_9PEZI|nr:hypothetical protein B0H66DRAFT_296359 [Apodospora peruviana]
MWIGFWVYALSQLPDGPTLSYPPTIGLPEWNSDDVPRFLFRMFDPSCSGQTDDDMVASPMSISEHLSKYSKFDIFKWSKWKPEKATEMLYRYLAQQWPTSSSGVNDYPDNLMSWSSSLPSVIQAALWSRDHEGYTQDEVKIVAVDTTTFRRGQFARDRKLPRTFH